MWEYFYFIKFENPLYISGRHDPKFGLTSQTARILIPPPPKKNFKYFCGWISGASYFNFEKVVFLRQAIEHL